MAVVVAANPMVAVHVGLHGSFPKVTVTPWGRPESTENVTGLDEPPVRVASIGRLGPISPCARVTLPGPVKLKSRVKSGVDV